MYPFLFRKDGQDVITLALSPSKQVNIQSKDWNAARTDLIAKFGEPLDLGGLAVSIRAEIG